MLSVNDLFAVILNLGLRVGSAGFQLNTSVENPVSGTALIEVVPSGENRICVARGANDHLTAAQVTRVLGDSELLEPYKRRSEAAKLRAQIRVNESAEEAVLRQAELMKREAASESVCQRAAKDILDRAGVRVAKEGSGEIVIRFLSGAPQLGMPRRREDGA